MSDLTYREVGATAGTLPEGYHHVRRTAPLGHEEADFRRAAEAILAWEMHRRAGLRVDATHPRAEVGADVRIGLGPRLLSAPCRVVHVVEESAEAGFAYGTLAGHPVSGEESFMVTLGADGVVRGHVVAFSLPAHPLVRLAGPLARGAQSFMAGRYLRVLRGQVGAGAGGDA